MAGSAPAAAVQATLTGENGSRRSLTIELRDIAAISSPTGP
jgi:hypothetical protein